MGHIFEKEAIIMKQKISYKDAGVDIEKADRVIVSSKEIIQSTFNKNVLSSSTIFAMSLRIGASFTASTVMFTLAAVVA